VVRPGPHFHGRGFAPSIPTKAGPWIPIYWVGAGGGRHGCCNRHGRRASCPNPTDLGPGTVPICANLPVSTLPYQACLPTPCRPHSIRARFCRRRGGSLNRSNTFALNVRHSPAASRTMAIRPTRRNATNPQMEIVRRGRGLSGERPAPRAVARAVPRQSTGRSTEPHGSRHAPVPCHEPEALPARSAISIV
jgi:hypothetical protein